MSEQKPLQRWGGLVIPAATFLVGLLIGGLVIGVGMSGGDDSASAAGDDESSGSPSPSATASASPGDTVVTIPAACHAAADKLREATRVMRRAAGNVRDFNPDELVAALNRLEKLDNQTRPLVNRCSQVEVTTSSTPIPSDSPSGS